jgi:hypothetical protein
MDPSYGVKDILNRSFGLEMPPVELHLGWHLNSYENSYI